MPTYRLRVEVPFHSDATSPVTDVLSSVGGNLVSVELREVDGRHAVDEVVVDFAHEPRRDALHRALDHDPAATLLSARRCVRDEPARRASNWARGAARTTASDPLADLPDRIGVACPLATVTVRAASEDARAIPAVKMAIDRRGPVAHRCAAMARSTSLSERRGQSWLLAVADRYPDPEAIALLERPVSIRFSADEAARVGLLMGDATNARSPRLPRRR